MNLKQLRNQVKQLQIQALKEATRPRPKLIIFDPNSTEDPTGEKLLEKARATGYTVIISLPDNGRAN